MPEIEVRCTISNCHYWDEGNRCGADTILITSDEVSRRFPDSVDVGQIETILNRAGETPSDDAMSTCCKTFRPKDGPREEDAPRIHL